MYEFRLKISLKFVPKGPLDNIWALAQIMARHLLGDKPLSEPMMISLLTHICITRPQWVNNICILMHLRLNYMKRNKCNTSLIRIFHSRIYCSIWMLCFDHHFNHWSWMIFSEILWTFSFQGNRSANLVLQVEIISCCCIEAVELTDEFCASS